MKSVFPLIAGLLGTALCTGACADSALQPIVTGKNRFRIPYRFDASEMNRLGAKEIRLFVSADFGSQWHLVQSVAPESGRFEFKAPRDGEYWFAVRTLDAQNQLHPSGSTIEPGLKVIVDTTPPAFHIDLRESAPGKVGLTWNASDPQLDANTLRLEYIQPGLPDWQLVTVAQQPSGQTAWSVPEGGVVAVRGSIADSASNVSRTQIQVHVTRAEQVKPKPPVPDYTQPIATIQPGTHAAAAPNPRSSFIASTYPASAQMRSADLATTQPLHGQTPPADWLPWTGGQTSASAAKKRLVNSTRFQISYHIDEVGPSGVSRVELFITQDNSQKWWKYGDDSDLTSPFDVEVPGDGVYGFSLRVRSGVGLAQEAPRPGQPPHIVVVVDQTPPVVQLMPIKQGQGADLNKIVIEWTMADGNPTEEPVSLHYAASPDGPWEPISGWQANTGQYVWSVKPGVPPRMFIQLLARDAAGNVSRVVTQQPVLVDLTKPTARIVDVETITTGSRY